MIKLFQTCGVSSWLLSRFGSKTASIKGWGFLHQCSREWNIGKRTHFSPSTVHNIIKWFKEFQCIKSKGTSLSWKLQRCLIPQTARNQELSFIHSWYNHMDGGLLKEAFVKYYSIDLHSQIPLKIILYQKKSLILTHQKAESTSLGREASGTASQAVQRWILIR